MVLPVLLFHANSESARYQVVFRAFPSRHRLRAKHSVEVQKAGKYIHLARRDLQALLGQTRSRSVISSKCFGLVADRLQVHA
jgi:hypothetical protein